MLTLGEVHVVVFLQLNVEGLLVDLSGNGRFPDSKGLLDQEPFESPEVKRLGDYLSEVELDVIESFFPILMMVADHFHFVVKSVRNYIWDFLIDIFKNFLGRLKGF